MRFYNAYTTTKKCMNIKIELCRQYAVSKSKSGNFNYTQTQNQDHYFGNIYQEFSKIELFKNITGTQVDDVEIQFWFEFEGLPQDMTNYKFLEIITEGGYSLTGGWAYSSNANGQAVLRVTATDTQALSIGDNQDLDVRLYDTLTNEFFNVRLKDALNVIQAY